MPLFYSYESYINLKFNYPVPPILKYIRHCLFREAVLFKRELGAIALYVVFTISPGNSEVKSYDSLNDIAFPHLCIHLVGVLGENFIISRLNIIVPLLILADIFESDGKNNYPRVLPKYELLYTKYKIFRETLRSTQDDYLLAKLSSLATITESSKVTYTHIRTILDWVVADTEIPMSEVPGVVTGVFLATSHLLDYRVERSYSPRENLRISQDSCLRYDLFTDLSYTPNWYNKYEIAKNTVPSYFFGAIVFAVSVSSDPYNILFSRANSIGHDNWLLVDKCRYVINAGQIFSKIISRPELLAIPPGSSNSNTLFSFTYNAFALAYELRSVDLIELLNFLAPSFGALYREREYKRNSIELNFDEVCRPIIRKSKKAPKAWK